MSSLVYLTPRTYVSVSSCYQALLSTVIGKHGIFAQFGITAPITAVFRTLEAHIDVSL